LPVYEKNQKIFNLIAFPFVYTLGGISMKQSKKKPKEPKVLRQNIHDVAHKWIFSHTRMVEQLLT
jgi:hypothetical protein